MERQREARNKLSRSRLSWPERGLTWVSFFQWASVLLFFVSTLAWSATFNFRLTGEPETLDWNRAHTPMETHLLVNLMEGLVGLDQGLQVIPKLAESWKVSQNGLVYTFQLRPGVKWSDGVPLKAQDFAYSWQRLLTPSTAAAYAYLLFDVVGAQDFNRGKIKDFSQVGVKVLNDRTLQVTLRNPLAYWIQIPTFWVTYPLRKDAVEKYGSRWDQPGKMVTLGAYELVSHEVDTKITLRANPYYYGKKGPIDTVIAWVVTDASAALNLYEAGRLDFMEDISTMDLKRLQGRADLKFFPYLKTVYLGMSVHRDLTSALKFRRAIGMAIDRSKFEQFLYGGQKAAFSFVPPPMMGHSSQVGLPYDPIQAKKELAASGVQVGEGKKLELLTLNFEKSLLIGQYIQSELKKNLGIEVVLQPFDNKTYRAQLDLRQHSLFLTSWSADYPDPDNFLTAFMSDSGNNRTGWKNPVYDQGVSKAREIKSVQAREKAYIGLQKIFLEENSAMVPLYYEPNTVLVNPHLKGFKLSPVNSFEINQMGWEP